MLFVRADLISKTAMILKPLLFAVVYVAEVLTDKEPLRTCNLSKTADSDNIPKGLTLAPGDVNRWQPAIVKIDYIFFNADARDPPGSQLEREYVFIKKFVNRLLGCCFAIVGYSGIPFSAKKNCAQ
jgi:hypothetical protein